MKYYTLSNSTGKETGRSYPQLHCLTQPYAHSMSSWEFPAFMPKLHFELEKTGKLTDVLSQSSIGASGFLINDKVRDILSAFSLMKHKYYDATVVLPKTGETLKYNWLHLCQPELTFQLDYDKSEFYEVEWATRKGRITINSFEHYKELKSKDKEAKFGVRLEEIVVTEKFNKDSDLFYFLPFSINKFISSRLKDTLENEKVTGLEYEPATAIQFNNTCL